jgi:tetratricopeptide (TPR) repeat protein
MSLLLDALKEAEARKRAPREAPSPRSPDTDGALALVEDPPEMAILEQSTPAPRPAPPVSESVRSTSEPPLAVVVPGRSSRRLTALIGLVGALLLTLGFFAIYEALRSGAPEPVMPAVPIGSTDSRFELPAHGAADRDAADAERAGTSKGTARRPAAQPHTSAVRLPGAASSRPPPRESATAAAPPPRGRGALDVDGAPTAGQPLRIARRGDPLAEAYAAVHAGELDRARELYASVLTRQPGQPDAELGLAVIAHAQGQDREAMRGYQRVLESIPDQPRAWAGLAELAGASEASALESRLRQLLAARPAAPLHFALGNLLARQQRWSDAQVEFFEAAALAPQVADYAFNLAVSLDRLGKSSAAASYYDRALELAGERGAAGFDVDAARARRAALAEVRQ